MTWELKKFKPGFLWPPSLLSLSDQLLVTQQEKPAAPPPLKLLMRYWKDLSLTLLSYKAADFQNNPLPSHPIYYYLSHFSLENSHTLSFETIVPSSHNLGALGDVNRKECFHVVSEVFF